MGKVSASVFLASLLFVGAMVGAQESPPELPAVSEEVAEPSGAPALPDLGDIERQAAEEAEQREAATRDEGYTAWQIIQFAGVIGYIIIALSVVAVGLVIEYALTIRRGRLMPTNVVAETRRLLDEGRYDEAEQRVQKEPSFVGYVVARGLRERDRGYEAMVKAMEDAADESTGARLRRVEQLNIIGNISPMLGLLGTVLGMTRSFNEIAQAVGGVDPRMLAGGVFQALITTVMGLIVAIPSLYFYAFFRNRIDAIISEATLEAEHMTEVFKEGRRPPKKAAES